jgi:hypothetical protein
MNRHWRFVVSSLALFLSLQHLRGEGSFPGLIPNGTAFSCANCHSASPPRFSNLNAFGNAFLNAGLAWTTALAALDSDQDGSSNGQELGDPAGTWKEGDADPAGPVFNPGDPGSHPAAATPPSITTQPVSQTLATGATATFSVVATGSGTLTYQWQKDSVILSDGGNISGATNATLSLSNITTNDQGSYAVIVSNGTSPPATSTPANLNVTGGSPPSLGINRQGDQIRISWPASASGYKLQETPDLSTSAWTLVDGTPVVQGDQFTLTLIPSATRRFYRLALLP